MMRPNQNINHHFWYYQHEPKETLILDESIDITIKNMKSYDGHSLLMNNETN